MTLIEEPPHFRNPSQWIKTVVAPFQFVQRTDRWLCIVLIATLDGTIVKQHRPETFIPYRGRLISAQPVSSGAKAEGFAQRQSLARHVRISRLATAFVFREGRKISRTGSMQSAHSVVPTAPRRFYTKRYTQASNKADSLHLKGIGFLKRGTLTSCPVEGLELDRFKRTFAGRH